MAMRKILLVCAVLFLGAVSFGVPILEEDFETGLNGQAFPGWAWPAGQVITKNGIDGKSLMIYDGNPSLGDWGIVSPDFSTPTYGLIEFDLKIDTPCVYASSNPNTNPEAIAFYTDGKISVGTPLGFVSTSATWTANQSFRLGVLSLEKELFVYINDSEIAHVQRSDLYSNLPVHSFYFRYSAGGVVLPGTIMIDNVSIVPEPMTLALLGAGCLMIRRRQAYHSL